MSRAGLLLGLRRAVGVALAAAAVSVAGIARAREPAGDAQGGQADPFTPHPAAAIATEQEKPSQLVPKYASGFFLANGTAQSVPAALARSRADFGLTGVVGIAATGTPWEKWEYLAYVVASVADDAVNGLGGGISPEQITVQYKPIKPLAFLAGWQRIPFSAGQSSVITTGMFPTRPGPTEVFMSGADAGILASFEALEARVKAKAGLFDGLSLRLRIPNHTTRGPVYATWLELAPLGAMAPIEGDFTSGPFRFAIAGGLLYQSGTTFDPTGYRGLDVTDTRLSTAFRAAVAGIYLQGEYLHAVQTDVLSARPRITRGAYGEGSYHVRASDKVGLAPVVRVGWTSQDANFFPLHVVTAEAGLALFPRRDVAQGGALRVLVEYLSERRIEESSTAYGGLLSVMYRF